MKLDDLETKGYNAEKLSDKNGFDLDEFEKLINQSEKKQKESITLVLTKELSKFFWIFWVLTVFGIIFVNFNLFYYELKSTFFSEQTYAENSWFTSIQELSSQKINIGDKKDTEEKSHTTTGNQETHSNSSQKDTSIQETKLNSLKETTDSFTNLKKENIKEKIDELTKEKESQSQTNIYEKHIEKKLFTKNRKYDFEFNLLPPDNRIIIPSIGVDAPLVDTNYSNTQEMMYEENFEEELYEWVVNYPFTPDPDESWNTFVFGHTSYYWRKDNPYWEVFARMWQLSNNDKIKVIREWNLHEYKVTKEKIMRPAEVTNFYEQHKHKDAITLMWCYPIGSDAQRILIKAEKTDTYQNKNLAVNN